MASFLATAIFAYLRLLRLAMRSPQARIAVRCRNRVSMTCEAVNNTVRVKGKRTRIAVPSAGLGRVDEVDSQIG